ncbi:hypothetical protein [Microbacterium dextranolyticum]|uniref:Uncharacterized protein n=1 Tax=Microbacterium dextranolyticum TaxID=36806 RepID=A0A9W6HLI4_9MICO|nr:hypothetical protein [Microbacterium dextranolyticum]MBM7464407.1 hypothetical protein [Microbacterium dextranolyticum]GLJ94825.1 hypothetical protein GCM10017591_08870 [Microbacterium dextranolyticum]
MSGIRIARLSLRVDAVYCVALGLLIALSAPLTSDSVALPPLLLAAVGVATALWGGYVWTASFARPLRSRTRAVMIANIVASTGLATTGLFAGTVVLCVAALVLAIDVAAFAVSQGVALRRMATPTL